MCSRTNTSGIIENIRLRKKSWRYRNSIAVDLSIINDSRYLAWHLLIYRVTEKLNSIFYFNSQWLGPSWNLCTKVAKHIKSIFSSLYHTHIETHAFQELLRHFVHLGFCTKILLVYHIMIWRTLQKLQQSSGCCDVRFA